MYYPAGMEREPLNITLTAIVNDDDSGTGPQELRCRCPPKTLIQPCQMQLIFPVYEQYLVLIKYNTDSEAERR